jgi:type IV fimbrial biogenesis protein FimT
MSIVAITLAIGIPSFQYVTTTDRMSSELNNLIGDMQFARAEAIKEGQTVTVCASANQSTCSGAVTWNSGWIVYSGNGAQPAAGTILRVRSPFTGGDSFQPADGTTSALQFNREGFAINLAGTITIRLHDPNHSSSYTRCLQLSVIGVPASIANGVGACS